MWLLIPILAIGSLPTVRVTTHGCGTEALIGTLQTLRPALAINAKAADANQELSLTLEKASHTFVLRLTGEKRSLTRSFADPGDCDSAGRTAALLVDGALDDLSTPIALVPLEPLGPSKPKNEWNLAGMIGLGGRQSLLGASATTMLDVRLDQGLFESRFELEYAIPDSRPLVEGDVFQGAFVASGMTPTLLEGVGFQAGVGRLSLTAEVGIELTFLSATGLRLLHLTPQTIVEPFGGLRVNYAVPLPERFFLSVQLDERVAPALARFQVEGIPSHVTTRTWTLAGALLLGRHFF